MYFCFLKNAATLKTLILIFCFLQILFSQEKDTFELKPRLGVFFHTGIAINFADFAGLPNVPSCCPQYKTTTGMSYQPGITLNYPINYNWLINSRISYSLVNTNFTTFQDIYVNIDGETVKGESKYNLNTNFALLNFDFNAMYTLDSKINFMIGPRLSFIMNKNYSQYEELTKPTDRGVFTPEYSRQRNQSEGEIDFVSIMLFGLNFGASYRMPLTKSGSLFIVPEAFYHLNFNGIISDSVWTMHSLNVGLAIEYRQPPPPPPPPPPPANPPMPGFPKVREIPVITAEVTVTQLDEFGKKQDKVGIKIEDFISFNMRPLLNYIFFDENSYQIPNRYIKFSSKQARDFDFKQLQNLNAIETYYYVLNIFGKRLSDNPKENITLVGTNQDEGLEKNNIDLSRKRAESVRDYLTTVWNIDEERIKIQARNLPKQYSRSDTLTGLEENRRVEIIVNPELAGSVLTVDTLRQINKTTLRFVPEYKAEAGLDKWQFVLKQGERNILIKEGNGNIPNFIDWVFETGSPDAPKSGSDLFYDLQITDKLGQKIKSKTKVLKVEQLTVDRKRLERQKDKEYEYYGLILFPYGGAELGEEHRKVVDFVKERIKESAETGKTQIKIFGFTDLVGDDKINKRIATSRANAVYRRLNIKDAYVEGVGKDKILYDNELPEGRFYCRTVQIEVETNVGD